MRTANYCNPSYEGCDNQDYLPQINANYETGKTAIGKGNSIRCKAMNGPDGCTDGIAVTCSSASVNQETLDRSSTSTTALQSIEIYELAPVGIEDASNENSADTDQTNFAVKDSERITFPKSDKVILAIVDPEKPATGQSKESSAKRGVNMGKKGWTRVKTAVAMTSMLQETRNKSPGTPKGKLERQDSFLKKFSTLRQNESARSDTEEDDPDPESDKDGSVQDPKAHACKPNCFRQTSQRGNSQETSAINRHRCRHKKPFSFHDACHKIRHCIFDPHGSLHLYWLGVVTSCVLYNLWSCIAREAFREIREEYDHIWFTFDGIADSIYFADIIVQLRTSYLECGLLVKSTKKLTTNYVRSKYFILDLASLIPLDFIQFAIGVHPIIRFPRFIKVYRAIKWKSQVENRTQYPNVWRVLNLIHILLIGAHWFAAFYYLISESSGFSDEGGWAYPTPNGTHAPVLRKYLRSFYWATLTLTTIGDLPAPEKNWQYVFTIVSYLIGVFVFATIVGQVGNVITNRNAARQEFEQILDNTKSYMRLHNVPTEMQNRVLRWYDYAWARGRSNGGGDINALGLLPDKLKTELALHVNLETLRKVTIFHECRPEFLHDLVLKMRPYIFTPGDYICRKGEVAREMFIIADGVLEVISDSEEVLAKMGSGAFFGEIGILNLEGGINRRTADVRSVGYCELFVLSKEDVLNALKDHPDAEIALKTHAKIKLSLLAKTKPRTKETHRTSSPNLTDNALQTLTKDAGEQLSNTIKTIIVKNMREMEIKFRTEVNTLKKEAVLKDEEIKNLQNEIKRMQRNRKMSLPKIADAGIVSSANETAERSNSITENWASGDVMIQNEVLQKGSSGNQDASQC